MEQHPGPSPEASGTHCRCSCGWRAGEGHGCEAGGVKRSEGHSGRGVDGGSAFPVELNEGGPLNLLLQGTEGYKEEAGLEAEDWVM